ncbi:MAG: glycosyltransferase family 2 protein [Lachnospiraceae bacterium]|nr:glycosyltransferase family 2 protein [Lachnospiraceae bacterium]
MVKRKVDIIISCFNEEDNIFPFYNEAKKYLKDKKYNYNFYFIDDGSTDNTYNEIVKLKNKVKNSELKVSCISFIHNFGHESAMCAGLENSKADYLIFIDVDLQNPPSKIKDIMEKFEAGADCVLLRRVEYKTASFFKKFTSKSYYWFSKYILRNKNARDVSDFFAIDKSLAKKVSKNYKTTLRFIRSFVQREAKNIMFVDYKNGARHSGVSRYNYVKLTKLALISELSRSKFLRDWYKVTKDNPIYKIDKRKSFYR